MRSIFEDDENLDLGMLMFAGPGPQEAPSSPGSITIGSITGFTRTTSPSKRKRTKEEAFERIQSLPSPSKYLEESALYGAPLAGVARALRKPLIVYESAKLGAMGLIILDPLDRLE